MAMTKQEIFNKVWDTFVVQKAPKSTVGEGGDTRCMYRKEGTPGCAIGCLIQGHDELYAEQIEGMGPGSILDGSWVNNYYSQRTVPIEDYRMGVNLADRLGRAWREFFGADQYADLEVLASFLGGLQLCHDDADPRDFHRLMESRLRGFANRHRLEVPGE